MDCWRPAWNWMAALQMRRINTGRQKDGKRNPRDDGGTGEKRTDRAHLAAEEEEEQLGREGVSDRDLRKAEIVQMTNGLKGG